MRFSALSVAGAASVLAAFVLVGLASMPAPRASASASGEGMPAAALSTLQRVYELVQMPGIVEFVAEERYRKHPFQGMPLDGVYSKGFRKVMKPLTGHEKMLAFGWVNPQAEDFWRLDSLGKREYLDKHPTPEGRGWVYSQYNPAWTTVFLYHYFYQKHGRTPASMWELIRDRECGRLLLSGEAVEQPERYLKYISPVTGKFIEFTHEELSPGNMWITVVAPEVMKKVADRWVGTGTKGEPVPMTGFSGTIYYYRVYGYEGIIRTGMLEVSETAVGIQ